MRPNLILCRPRASTPRPAATARTTARRLAPVVLAASLIGCGPAGADQHTATPHPSPPTPTAPSPTPTVTSTVRHVPEAPDTTIASPTTTPRAAPAFDPTVVHHISATFESGDYDALLAAYADGGEKDWMEASVTIDGSTYPRAGMRLKGNSSLSDVRDLGTAGASIELAAEALPWLIRLDRNVEGENHHGQADFVIRSNHSESALNEAVALDLLARAGLASQQAVSAQVSMNGSDPLLRLVVELPDDDFWQASHFDAPGALFKAEAGGDWSYRGADPDAYDDVFDQKGGEHLTDLTPLIEFLEFVDDSDDATFARELPGRLDIDAFATYLAMMELIDNFDDIDGPGNNAYLWWDAATGRFTVVPWDMNLAFGGFGQADAGDGFPVTTFPKEFLEQFPGGSLPDDFTHALPGGTLPEGIADALPAYDAAEWPPHPLVDRFHGDAGFTALYARRLTELRAELFESGLGEAILDARVATLRAQAAHLIAADALEADAAWIRIALDR